MCATIPTINPNTKHQMDFVAAIQVNGKMISFGSYANKDEAGRAYNVAGHPILWRVCRPE
jgi:hypothetical protein